MSKTVKNIITILGLVTIIFGGYYLYATVIVGDGEFVGTEEDLQDMLDRTRVYIDNGVTLERINFDLGLFEDERFTSKRSFSEEIEFQPVGRDNPFAPVSENSASAAPITPTDETSETTEELN